MNKKQNLNMSNKISVTKNGVEILIEGDAKFVEKNFDLLKKEFFGSVGQIQTTGDEKGKKNITNETLNSQKDLFAFYNEKKPSTHYDKIAVFGYYLTELSGKETFTAKGIDECYRELRSVTKLPGNINVTIQDTIKKAGYVKTVSTGIYKLTSPGINHVSFDLPIKAE
jgi:hypothetical protein